MTSGLLSREPYIATFAYRDNPMPDLQNPVDSLSEYSARKKYGVELHRRRKKRRQYLIL